MSIYLNWSRWIFSSIAKHFHEVVDPVGILLNIEGIDRISNEIVEGGELRVNGPYFNNPSRNYYILDLDVNLLLNVLIDERDIYKLDRMLGVFLGAFTPTINVYRYGDSQDDDSSYFGCLQIRDDRGDEIVVARFGQVEKDTRILQAAINAIYYLEFKI
jgi:hypothetical protein